MNFLPEAINQYIEKHSSSLDENLEKLYRETNMKVLMGQMISGPYQGNFLRMVSQMQRPKYILEVGTFTGYASICLCAGLAEGGMLHTIEINEELCEIQDRYFKATAVDKKIQRHIGNALQLIPDIDVPQFDLIFLDADKRQYPAYYELLIPRLAKGGLLLADNTLWMGKVIAPDVKDEDALGIDAFNKLVMGDRRVENILIPIRDGIMMARKLV